MPNFRGTVGRALQERTRCVVERKAATASRAPNSGAGFQDDTTKATEEPDWSEVPDRNKVSRLREAHWISMAEAALRPNTNSSFVGPTLHWHPTRGSLGRKLDHPGDGVRFTRQLFPGDEAVFEWLEVTEVFTIVPAKEIQAAMEDANGLSRESPVSVEDIAQTLHRGRPSRALQRRAADDVLKTVEKKLCKRSYDELAELHGYGTLVVGLPLWFAVPPDDPLSGSRPALVEHLAERSMTSPLERSGARKQVTLVVLTALCRLLWFTRTHGRPKGLAGWIVRKMSLSQAWKTRALTHRTRVPYRESRSRDARRRQRRGASRPNRKRRRTKRKRRPQEPRPSLQEVPRQA